MRPRRKINYSKTLDHIAQYFEECTGATAIHGVQYIGDRKRTWFERILWTAIVAVSVYMCIKFVMQTYRKWERSPVYVTIGSGLHPIHDIVFPAITICPETKSDANTYHYPDWIEKAFDAEVQLSDEERLQFEYMSMICNRTDAQEEFFNHTSFDSDIYNFLYNITPQFNDTFKNCKFSSLKLPCEEIFTPVFTINGVCYTFNPLDRSEVFHKEISSFKDFYKATNSNCFEKEFNTSCQDPYPRRSSFSGTDAGLEVELRTDVKDLDFRCATALQGFKVIVHDPTELPTQAHNYFRIPLNQAVSAALFPKIIETEPSLVSYTPKQRQCYFENEKSLIRFKYYTQKNCEVECLAYLMENALDCLDFYLPRTNKSVPICGPDNIRYMNIMEQILITYISNTTALNLGYESHIIKALLEEWDLVKYASNFCDCLPSCSSSEFNFETTQTDYFWYYFYGQKEYKEKEYRSLVNIYFKDSYFIPMRREEMFGAMDFIAYSGGLLGLFVGFSIVSLIEIIYFLSLRIVCNIILFGKKMWYEHEVHDEEVESK